MSVRRPLRVFAAFLCLCVLVAPARATWSIVVVDRRTGEVGVASATCLLRLDLLKGLPTIVPGIGAGVVQSAGDSTDLLPMTDGLRARLAPSDILLLARAADSDDRKLQSGIVSLYPGAPVTYSGIHVGAAKNGVAGQVGDLAYAIQGNVLTGKEVVTAAEAALLSTPGDLGQKLLAAMQAAHALGGDGRCSCDPFHPTDCGVPPPTFEKSAHVGFLVVARIGDPAPPCVRASECGLSDFHLVLDIFGRNANEDSPDPVDQLTARYATWRASRAGLPDGLLSRVDAVDSLPADGVTKRVVTVRLHDIEGVPLDHGGATVRVDSLGGARWNSILGGVTDHGDGTYTFPVSSTFRAGLDRLVITAEEGPVKATLYPYPEVRSVPRAALHCGRDDLSASAGGRVPFVLDLPAFAGGNYLVLASASGTSPGVVLARAGLLPLVRDPLFALSAELAGDPALLPGMRGVLDASGRAEAAFVAPPALLSSLIGLRLSWAAVAYKGSAATTTNAVGFDVGP